MIIFLVAATLREERLLLEKKYIYVCIFLLRVAPDFYSQQSREQYLDKFIDSYIHVSVHTIEIKELKSSLQALEVEFCNNNANIYGSRCLKGEIAYSKKGEHCLGGKHGNQVSANHPALSY